jgi:HEAT repeat protein
MLAAIGDKESLSLIRPALDDREPMVRRAAKKALARLGEPPRNAPEAKE